MEEWKEYKLGNLCSISSSKRIFADEYQLSGIPFYRGKEIIEKQKGEPITNELYISEDRYNEIKDKYGTPQRGDMLLTSVGTLGIPYIVKDEKFYFKDGNLTWFYNFRGINNVYLYYWFLSPTAQYLINAKAIGSTQKALTIETLKKFDLIIPPIDVQNQIVAILKSFDDKIECNRRINDNLEQQAQALFRSWFVDFEPFKDDELMESELGMIPKSLELQYISEIPHVLETGRRPKGGVGEISSGVPSVGAEHVKGLGNYDYAKTKYITEEYAASLKTGKVNGYELLIYKDGGKPGYFIPNYSIFGEGYPFEECFLNEHVFKLDFGDKGYNAFCYFYFWTDYVMNYLNAQGGKAAIPGINRQDIENIQIFAPENELVKRFGDIVLPSIRQILFNCKESRRLSQLRDALLPRLMSGELKVNEIEMP